MEFVKVLILISSPFTSSATVDKKTVSGFTWPSFSFHVAHVL